MDQMKELVAYIARSIVDEPDAVTVDVVDEDSAVVLELTVAQGDLGKVIGKEARTARPIRTLLSASSAKLRKRAILEILE